MTALDPSSATRVLEIPATPFRSISFGDIDLAVDSSDPDHPVIVTPEGAQGIPRRQETWDPPAPAIYLNGDGPIVPSVQDHLTIIATYGAPDDNYTWGVVSLAGYCRLVLESDSGSTSLDQWSEIGGQPIGVSTPLPTAPAGGIELYAMAQTSSGRFVASLTDGVIFSDATVPALPSGAEPSIGTYSGASDDPAILGMWVWEGQSASEADVLDTLQAIRDALLDPPEPEPCGPSTIGSDFYSAVVQAVFGPAASGVFPSTFWGAWLDADLEVIAETGITIPQDTFGPAGAGVTNTAIIDGGTCPATTPAHFALLDAEGGRVVAYAPVTFESPPDEGDELAFAQGALTFAYGG